MICLPKALPAAVWSRNSPFGTDRILSMPTTLICPAVEAQQGCVHSTFALPDCGRIIKVEKLFQILGVMSLLAEENPF
jgi:hypothetical protein